VPRSWELIHHRAGRKISGNCQKDKEIILEFCSSNLKTSLQDLDCLGAVKQKMLPSQEIKYGFFAGHFQFSFYWPPPHQRGFNRWKMIRQRGRESPKTKK
jgi:hypothetical protein